jgi:hypothetical protein
MLEAALAFAALDRRGNLWVLVEIKEFVDHDAKCKDPPGGDNLSGHEKVTGPRLSHVSRE